MSAGAPVAGIFSVITILLWPAIAVGIFCAVISAPILVVPPFAAVCEYLWIFYFFYEKGMVSSDVNT